MKMKGLMKFLFGLLLIVGAVYLAVAWWDSFSTVILGGLPWLIALIGGIFLLLGFEK